MTAKITALMNEPEANGDYVAELTMPDGTTSTATISLDVARSDHRHSSAGHC